MSAAAKEDNVISEKKDTMLCCASCGAAEGDDIQLKKCNGCYLVRYCSVTCQRNHRPKHKKACKKRAAELRDELLFKQPESSYMGDCPICCLPLPIDDEDKTGFFPCCSKIICRGCVIANRNKGLQPACPFCRDTLDVDPNLKVMKRIEANDPRAMYEMGLVRRREGNYGEAFQLFTKAAKLGDARAQFKLSVMYGDGDGVEKDEKKEIYYLEEAAIGGHPGARYNLSRYEMSRYRKVRSVKHLMIAANLGHDQSLQTLKELYKRGSVSKEDFATALRAHKAAVDATKSPQRDAAKCW